ncbi:hypothetical protein [Williamsia sp.]|uniref:hypothetical protein n=1 Tax=Williamsia sp. TaxID=1872085 RepID=UPI002F94EE80
MNTPPENTNRRRATLILLAALDDDEYTARAVLDEAWAESETAGLCGIIASMTTGMLELFVTTAGPDATRKTLDLTLLNLSLEDGDV